MPSSSNPFQADERLQRRTEERARPDWLQAARADPQTLYLVSRGTTHLIRREPETRIAFISPETVAALPLDESQQVLMGWFRGRRCVLVDLPPTIAFQPPGTVYEELRPLLPQVPEDEAYLLTSARALLVWRSRHRHCGLCGAPTRPRSAGHVLVCTAAPCGAQFFPRIEPAIIVLVTHGTRALLGRQPSWPAGRYSTIAGFVDAGESLEEAVTREVLEETGAAVRTVRYFASQPWPFPASLMLGFHATAPESEIRLDGELEDARWFDRAQLRAGGVLLLPPPHTIARRLIEAWLQEGGNP
jgi:NAD+ diphosphatase